MHQRKSDELLQQIRLSDAQIEMEQVASSIKLLPAFIYERKYVEVSNCIGDNLVDQVT